MFLKFFWFQHSLAPLPPFIFFYVNKVLKFEARLWIFWSFWFIFWRQTDWRGVLLMLFDVFFSWFYFLKEIYELLNYILQRFDCNTIFLEGISVFRWQFAHERAWCSKLTVICLLDKFQTLEYGFREKL